jgi:hypothetical protein
MRISFWIMASVFCVVVADLSAQSARQRTSSLERRIRDLKREVSEIQSELKDLERSEMEASHEYLRYESELKSKMRAAVVPLLHWNPRSTDMTFDHWIEREHRAAVLAATQDKLIAEPARLLSERSEKLKAIQVVREASETKLKEIESREALLKIQLEEWGRFKKSKKLPAKQGVNQP